MLHQKQNGANAAIKPLKRRRKQPVILLFKILKASETIAQRLTPALRRNGGSTNIIASNLNLSVFAFIIQCCYKLLINLYERKKARLYRQTTKSYKNRGYDHLPRSQWSNDYPVVLVHGFAGWAPDESPLFSDYWSYLSDPDVTGHHKIYQADVGPFNSLHDRACELYQQIVGIVNFKAQRNLVDNGPSLARAVYGDQHFDIEHAPHQTFYKPRYLRQVQQRVGKIYGFPKGLPQGWDKENKIHFVTHSMGGPTVRYLQYLLSIDYFALPGEARTDKSSWIASVTAISGAHNGSLGPHSGSINEKFLLKSDKRKYVETLAADVFANAMKCFATVQNIVEPTGTQEIEPENVVKVFKQRPQERHSLKSILVNSRKDSNHDIMYELGNQYGILMDLNHERAGYNKRQDETHMEYINRLAANDFAGKSHDHAVPEFPPGVFEQRNVLLQTHENTYYFSISSGEKKQRFLDCKEYLTEPEKMSKLGLGFDSDIVQNLKLTGAIRKIKSNGKQNLTSWERIYMFFRWIANPLSIYHKLFLQNFTSYKQPKYLNNLFNPNMNNLTALDYQNQHHVEDCDGILSRWSTEYPRLSMKYTSKAKVEHAPWGQKSRPVRFDCWQETPLSMQHTCQNQNTTLGGQTFDRGVWYYSGLELIDHHDFSGLENPWAKLETVCGRETRPQFSINLLNRLRMLDFTESTETDQDNLIITNSCISCKQKQSLEKLPHKVSSDSSLPRTQVADSISDVSMDSDMDD